MQAKLSSPEDIGRLVRHVRTKRALTQRELAARLGVSHRWLSELESGKGKQANQRYFEVLSALGIHLIGTVDDG